MARGGAGRARPGRLGMAISRPAWKNLVFTGASGTGKSWVARSLAGTYRELGVVQGGQVIEAAAAGMAGLAALRALYEELSAARNDLVVILAGPAGPVGELLEAHRPLAARFAAVIDFPGYEGRDLGAVFARLAADAGFRLGDGAQDRAAAVLDSEASGRRGSTRLAVSLLSMVTVAQARRIATSGENAVTITRADIPDQLDARFRSKDHWRPGQYL